MKNSFFVRHYPRGEATSVKQQTNYTHMLVRGWIKEESKWCIMYFDAFCFRWEFDRKCNFETQFGVYHFNFLFLFIIFNGIRFLILNCSWIWLCCACSKQNVQAFECDSLDQVALFNGVLATLILISSGHLHPMNFQAPFLLACQSHLLD